MRSSGGQAANESNCGRRLRALTDDAGDRCWRFCPRFWWSRRWLAIFVYLVYKGASSLNLAFFTQIPKPEGETGGGMANAIVGSGVLLALASAIGIPHRHRRRHLSGRVRPRNQAGQRGALHRRRAQRRAFHRDGPGGLCADRDAAQPCILLRHFSAFRRRGAGHHDDSHGHAAPPKRCC